MIQRQGGTGVVLRLMIVAGLLLASLPGVHSIAATPPGVDDAIRAQRLRLEMAPRDVAVLNDLANLLVLAGDVAEAEEVYQRALEIEPDRVTTIYNLALLQAETGRRKLAMHGFRKVLEIDPGHAWSHYQLGSLNAAAGKRNKAIGHYTEAFRLEPRLVLPEFNAHALDNELLLAALLQVDPAGSPSKTVPRIYKDPERVRALLFPPEARTSDSAESGQGARRVGGGIRSSGSSSGVRAGEMDEPVSGAREPERVEPVTKGRVPGGASAQSGAQRRKGPGRQIIRQPVRPAPPATTAGTGGAAAAREVVPPQPTPQPTPQPPPTQRSKPPPATAEPELEPVFSSTGRLDLRLVPNPQDRLASLADAPR